MFGTFTFDVASLASLALMTLLQFTVPDLANSTQLTQLILTHVDKGPSFKIKLQELVSCFVCICFRSGPMLI